MTRCWRQINWWECQDLCQISWSPDPRFSVMPPTSTTTTSGPLRQRGLIWVHSFLSLSQVLGREHGRGEGAQGREWAVLASGPGVVPHLLADCISVLGLPRQISTNRMAWNNISLFSPRTGGQEYKTQVLAGLVPSGGSEGGSRPCFSPSSWWLPVILGILFLVEEPLWFLPVSSHDHLGVGNLPLPFSYKDPRHHM